MCCHDDNKHAHAHAHDGKEHVHEHIHDAEHKHGHKCCHWDQNNLLKLILEEGHRQLIFEWNKERINASVFS